jgi:hypothetical protein
MFNTLFSYNHIILGCTALLSSSLVIGSDDWASFQAQRQEEKRPKRMQAAQKAAQTFKKKLEESPSITMDLENLRDAQLTTLPNFSETMSQQNLLSLKWNTANTELLLENKNKRKELLDTLEYEYLVNGKSPNVRPVFAPYWSRLPGALTKIEKDVVSEYNDFKKTLRRNFGITNPAQVNAVFGLPAPTHADTRWNRFKSFFGFGKSHNEHKQTFTPAYTKLVKDLFGEKS